MPSAAPRYVGTSRIQRRFEAIARRYGRPAASTVVPPPSSPWLTSRDLAEYLRLTDRKHPRQAAREWAARQHVVWVTVNRERRYARLDVERALGLAR